MAEIKNNNSLKEQNNKLYEFKGQVIGKQKSKVYNKKSDYYNSTFYRLQVDLEDKPELKEVLVFQGSKIFKEIKASEYTEKRYLFFCSPKIVNYQVISYQLVDWKELENHGSDNTRTFNKSETEYGSN